MSRRPTGRKQSAARTRQRLLAAARDVFVERGYQAASIYEIAARAGYTIGAVYSQFGGKSGMFLELLDEHYAAQLEALEARLVAGADAAASAEIGGAFWSGFLEADPELVVLFVEFWSAAMRDEDVRERLARSNRRLRSALAELIGRKAEGAGVEVSAQPSEIAITVDALVDGFALHRLADRDGVPADLVGRALGWLVAGMASEARPEALQVKR